MKKIGKIEKEIKQIEDDVNDYIHRVSDIKIPTDKEFNRNKKVVNAKIIGSGYYTGISISSDVIYDAEFEYVIDNVVYRSRMQTINNYIAGNYTDIYYYKKDPRFIKEIIHEPNNAESLIIKILIFSILLVIASILFVSFYY